MCTIIFRRTQILYTCESVRQIENRIPGKCYNFCQWICRFLGALFKPLVLRAQEELGAVLRICFRSLWGKWKSDVDFQKSDVGFVKFWSPDSQISIWPFSKLRRSWACRFDLKLVLCSIFWKSTSEMTNPTWILHYGLLEDHHIVENMKQC